MGSAGIILNRCRRPDHGTLSALLCKQCGNLRRNTGRIGVDRCKAAFLRFCVRHRHGRENIGILNRNHGKRGFRRERILFRKLPEILLSACRRRHINRCFLGITDKFCIQKTLDHTRILNAGEIQNPAVFHISNQIVKIFLIHKRKSGCKNHPIAGQRIGPIISDDTDGNIFLNHCTRHTDRTGFIVVRKTTAVVMSRCGIINADILYHLARKIQFIRHLPFKNTSDKIVNTRIERTDGINCIDDKGRAMMCRRQQNLG